MPLNGLNLETSCSQTVAYDGKQLRSMPSAEPQAPSVIWIPQNWDGDQTVFEVLTWTYRENPEKSFSLSFIPAIKVNLESPVKHSWPVCGPLCHPRASLLSSKLTCCSVTQSSPTLCHPWPVACQAFPHHFPEFDQVRVHCISSCNALFSFCPQSLPASGTFPMSRLFASDDQNTGASASASVLAVNIQGWSPLRLTGLISLLSKGLTGVFSSTTLWRHQFFGVLLSLRSSFHNRRWPLGRP